ncbi:MAG: hypothetical protein [Bacteriophage sp.]|nr:MAG: hypothetical protein [Bacteriophage sp.]
MIQINLSDEQGRELLNAFGWRWSGDSLSVDNVTVKADLAAEVFRQLENQVEAQRREKK